jgi:Flp pilus assembly protein TadG
MTRSASSVPPAPAGGTDRALSSRRERGQAAVELALAVPVVCLLLLALIDFGKALNYWLDANHLASEGARIAAVAGNSTDPCGNGMSLTTCIQRQAETAELRDGGGSITAPARVCVSFPNGTPKIGDPVNVQVTASYKWIPFVGGATLNITADSTMRLERLPTYEAGCS